MRRALLLVLLLAACADDAPKPERTPEATTPGTARLPQVRYYTLGRT